MRAHRLAGPTLAAAFLLLAGLIALSGLIDFFAAPDQRWPTGRAPLPSGQAAGPERFGALSPFGWLAVAPTPTQPPPPPPTEVPAPPAAYTAPEVSSQPEAASPVVASEPPAVEYQDYDLAAAVLEHVNGARTARGLAPLAADAALTAAAQDYAQLLTQLDAFSHDADGPGLLGRVQASGYAGVAVGEALWEGWGSYAPDQIVNDWLNSPTHRELLFNPAYVDAGLACYVRDANGALNTRCVLDAGG